MLTTTIGGAFGVVGAAISVWGGDKGNQAGGEPGAPDATTSARSPQCKIRSDGLYCTGTAGVTTYSQRDRASPAAQPLGPESLFVCWGKGKGDEIWYWVAFRTKDEPWGNVPARMVSTHPIPATGLKEC